jgi:hypothetical protein
MYYKLCTSLIEDRYENTLDRYNEQNLFRISNNNDFVLQVFYQILKGINITEKHFENLKRIKITIRRNVGSNKNDYLLLKDLLNNSIKYDFLHKIYIALSGAIMSLILWILQRYSTNFIDKWLNGKSISRSINLYMDTGTIIIFILVSIVFLYNHLTITKRQKNFLLKIIDSIVRELD